MPPAKDYCCVGYSLLLILWDEIFNSVQIDMFGQPLEVNLLAVITSVYVHTPEYSPICCKPTTIAYTYSVDIASTAAGVIAVAVIQVWYVVIHL